MASVFDVLYSLHRTYVIANSKRGAERPPIVRYPRPNDDDEHAAPGGMSSTAAIATYAKATGGKVKVTPRTP